MPCDAALAQWFDGVDANRDGRLDPTEFAADGARWFGVMDANRDGTVTPDELTALRLRLMPPVARPARGSTDDEASDRRRGSARGPFGRGGRRPYEEPDPVMEADLNLDNRVTLDEFRAQSTRNFTALDSNRDGRLSKDEVVASCALREQRARAGR